MLAFDIETTGLNKHECEVTVVCAQDFLSGKRYDYEFSKARAENQDINALTKRMCADFDAAPSLCAFNGVRFDLPFLVSLGVSQEKIAEWIVKTSDILEQCRLRGMPTFSLNMLCEANGIQLKSSDGKHAITMAQNGQWEDLRAYCADDVQILCSLYKQRFLKHPRTQQLMDTRDYAHCQLYSTTPAGAADNCKMAGGQDSALTSKVDIIITSMNELRQSLGRRLSFSDYSTEYIS